MVPPIELDEWSTQVGALLLFKLLKGGTDLRVHRRRLTGNRRAQIRTPRYHRLSETKRVWVIAIVCLHAGEILA